jgi:hypothetical protein
MKIKNFEMSQEQLDELLIAMRPVPMIATQCGGQQSPQGKANSAWARLGAKMGFDHMTVRPDRNKGVRFFTAEEKCRGIVLGDGNFSGCDGSSGDCPSCGDKT